MTGASEVKERLFPELDGDDTGVTELESLCMNCHEQGITRLLLTLIPHFREVIISSFTCDQCGFEDRTIQSGGRIQEKGVHYEVTIKNEKDLDRQVVKSEWATISLPEVDFEQPPSKRGEVTTVEGLLTSINEGLVALQPARREQIPETAAKIDEFIIKLTRLKLLDDPFTLVIDDPSGNSYVENPFVPETDPAMNATHYVRSRQHDVTLGLVADEEEDGEEEDGEEEDGEEEAEEEEESKEDKEEKKEENLQQEVLGFQTNCSECNSPCDTNMKVVHVPFFKECIIMATVCDACGFRDNEVKAGAGIEPKGKRMTLRLTDVSDLSRDVLKSDTCTVRIPEFEFELIAGTLGGRFTTVEGLLGNIKDQLSAKNPFLVGDSADDGVGKRLQTFCDKLQKVIDGETLDVHLELDDPAGNSYLQNVYAPEPDPEMTEEEYTRNYEQNEELGLNDMVTDNYNNTQ